MYVYGKNVAKQMLMDDISIKKAFIYKKSTDSTILKELQDRRIPIKYLEKYELDKMVDGNHQGVVLSIPDYEYCTLDDVIKDPREIIIILDHIEDPHNFGAIIRTCDSAGLSVIIIPKDLSVDVNSTVIKVSTGAINQVKIAQVPNLVRTIELLKKEGYWIIGTDMEGTSYKQIDYTGKIAIVIGNEGSGMSRIVKESCDFIATIPMRGTTNSLNASVATGIMIFEAISKR